VRRGREGVKTASLKMRSARIRKDIVKVGRKLPDDGGEGRERRQEKVTTLYVDDSWNARIRSAELGSNLHPIFILDIIL
jgi:hypothetical protein